MAQAAVSRLKAPVRAGLMVGVETKPVPFFETTPIPFVVGGHPLPTAAAPRFRPGQRVRVRRMRPEGHTRCPRYVRGASGVVERVHFADRLPDLAVYGERPAPEPVYAVRFRSEDLWGQGGEPPWTVSVDLWESYLEAVA